MAEVAAWHWAQGLRPHAQDTAVHICGMGGCGGTSGTGGAEVTGEEDQLGDRQELATVGGWAEECWRHAVADASRSRGSRVCARDRL